jgi:adenosylmethionine-8-amino-7-oxononanoate aminotransferase
VIERDDLLEQVVARGEFLMKRLHDVFDEHPHVGDIRGRGLFIGLEFVADRQSREPFDPALQINATLKRMAMDNGLMCYPMGGTIDGRRGDHVLLAPPFIATEDDIEQIVLRLQRALGRTLEKASATAGH